MTEINLPAQLSHGVCRTSGLTRSLTNKNNLCHQKRDYVRRHGVFQEANVELIVARDPVYG